MSSDFFLFLLYLAALLGHLLVEQLLREGDEFLAFPGVLHLLMVLLGLDFAAA